MPSKKITLTETALTEEERETVSAYVAAKRAATQSEAMIKKLSGPVQKLAKLHPDLLIDGARITLGTRKAWSYSVVIAGFKASLLAAMVQEQENGDATEKTTVFPVLKELSKFTGQAVTGIKPSVWERLFSK